MKGTIILAVAALVVMLALFVFVHPGSKAPEQTQPTASTSAAETSASSGRSTFESRHRNLLQSAEPANDKSANTNLWQRQEFDVPYLTREQVEPFLEKNGRSVEALLGALRASGDLDLLKEAKEKFPNDPRVQFAAAFKTGDAAERRQWLEKFKESAGDNALPNYLLATEHFKAGDAELGLKEIVAANGKSTFENYMMDFVQNTEEAYRTGGYSDVNAKTAALGGALLPELAELKRAGAELVDLATKYRQAGDPNSAQTVMELAMNLAHRLDGSPQTTIIQDLVGIAIERKVLDAMNPSAPYGDTSRTVQQQIDALMQRRTDIRELTKTFDAVLPNLSESDISHYLDRIKTYGSIEATKWAIRQAPRQ